jgi:hypothetical protein
MLWQCVFVRTNGEALSGSVFRNPSSPSAHPKLQKTYDGSPQDFASRKRDTKLYMTTDVIYI